MPETAILSAAQVGYRYGSHLPWVLKEVDFKLNEGERVGLFAPSGYGKTTLVKLLAGYLTPQVGRVFWQGEQPTRRGKAPVQLIHQHPELAVNPRWNMERVLKEAGEPSPDLLADLGIEPAWLSRLPGELSGGELQRFCLARAIIAKPTVLIADEMTTMLDVVTQTQLWQVVLKKAAAAGIALLIVSHNHRLLDRLCTRIEDLRQLNKI